MSETPLQLGAILFPGFEMLDTFGPLELFSVLGASAVRINTVAATAGPVPTALASDGPLGPKVIADYGFDDAPPLDLLLVPGGLGTAQQLYDAPMLEFLRTRAASARIVASVCTGSALLARAGLLDGRRATSNKQVFALAAQQSDRVEWVESARWVEDGPYFTSSGVTAGMDMALAIIERLWGAAVAEDAARYAEYVRNPDPTDDPFAGDLNVLARKLGLV